MSRKTNHRKKKRRSTAKQKEKRREGEGDDGRNMNFTDFAFESIYQIVTWVVIGLSIAGIAVFYSQQRWRLLMWAVIVLLCAIVVMIGIIADRQLFRSDVKLPQPELHGLLIPANDPTPPNNCRGIPSDAVVVFIGTTGFWTKETLPTIILNGFELIQIARTQGGINVSARVLSADNKVVAQITNNEFYVNPQPRLFHLGRPDWHTLIVTDSEGQEALYVRHLNPTTVSVRGRFYVSGKVIVATESQIILPGGSTFSGGCFAGGGKLGGMLVE